MKVGLAVAGLDVPVGLDAQELQAHLAAIVESSDDAILSKSLTGEILSWNQGAERLYGYDRSEAVGQSIHMIVPDERTSEVEGFLTRVAQGNRVEHHDTQRIRKDGSRVEVSVTISPIRSGDGSISAASVIARDITERQQLHRRLKQLAEEDQLTGIANRRIFIHQLERHIDYCGRYGWRGAVLIIDIDRFKSVNDTLGHGAGDQLLKQTAARLGRRLRSSDVLARMGGDEFAILLAEAGPKDTPGVADAIVRELARQEITIAGEPCATGSVGWTVIDEPVSADELMIRVDLAAYDAKTNGGNGSACYSPERDGRLRETGEMLFLAEARSSPDLV